MKFCCSPLTQGSKAGRSNRRNQLTIGEVHEGIGMKRVMELSNPYRKMASTCRTRPPREKRLIWTKVETEPLLGGRYQAKPLRHELIESAAQLWRMAYPELRGSPHEFLFDPDRCEQLMALEDTWEEDSRTKVYCMTVVEELDTRKVVSATLLTKFERNLQVEYSFAATHPDYRRRDLTDELRRVTRKIARNSGAEYFTTFCETWHDITQNWCIKGGWKIAGIFPGNFVRWNGDEEEYRGCTVHFYHFIGDGESYATKPKEWHLASPVKEVWKVLEKVNGDIESGSRRK